MDEPQSDSGGVPPRPGTTSVSIAASTSASATSGATRIPSIVVTGRPPALASSTR